MTLEIGNMHINLSTIKHVKQVMASASMHEGIAIHLICDKGNETELFDLLPKIIHTEMTVHKGHQQVFLTKD